MPPIPLFVWFPVIIGTTVVAYWFVWNLRYGRNAEELEADGSYFGDCETVLDYEIAKGIVKPCPYCNQFDEKIDGIFKYFPKKPDGPKACAWCGGTKD